jgi:hypothetical protein
MQPFMLTQGSLLELTRTHLRNLFWVCYTIDKDLCLRVRQPPALSDNYCDLALPLQYLEEISKDFTISLVSDQVHPSLMFPTDLKISQIKSQAYELLYSVPAFRKSNMELLMNIQNLSDSLEKCRLAVPEIERPSLSRRDTGKIGIRTMVSQLDYLHCMAVIHQASNRCLGDGMNYYGTAIVNTSGISLAVEASRSSLRYLQSVYHNLNEGSFW